LNNQSTLVAAGEPSAAELQILIDQVATFNVFVVPEPARSGSEQNHTGVVCGASLHRFDIDLEVPSESDMKAVNVLGEAEGRVDLHWLIIPNDFAARPDVTPPSTQLDPSKSQRFAMQRMTFTFGHGRDGFHSFGTGRTFPIAPGGRPRLVVAAIGTLTEGFGKFAGHEGTFTLCGELTPAGSFTGHIVARVLDEQGSLRTQEPLPPIAAGADRPDPQFTYLMWLAQKGKGPAQENRPSLTPDGKMRGLNIPMELKRGHSGFTVDKVGGFRAAELKIGEVIGLEVGFGRGSQPDATPIGTAISPFEFEGVARYTLDDRQGHSVGAITTNVLEGRRFDYQLAGAPTEVAWRFGFFGPVIYGSGCFRGVQGMFYGASNSILKPPPGDHIITHCYFARLYDPEGRLRAEQRRD
jgi:hypothetical protein